MAPVPRLATATGEAAPSADELLARARALQPALRARAEDANRRCDVPDESVAALRAADLFKMMRARVFGGFESDPRDFFDVQNAIAEACGSTAWVYGVLSLQYLLVATFDPRAQADVFAEDPEMLVSSSFQPMGKVDTVPGGYRLSGRWSFSSGCSHAGWAIIGGLAPPRGEDGPAVMKIFLVPKGDYRVDPVWDAFGLRATGSHDLVLDGAFVPEHRATTPDLSVTPPRDVGPDHPLLHRLPWFFIFTVCIANLGIGITRGATRAFVEATRGRMNGYAGTMVKDEAAVQAAVATAYMEADAAETTIRRHIAAFTDAVVSGREMSDAEGYLYRVQAQSIMDRLGERVDRLQRLMGARGIASRAPLVRPWLDLMAARNHPGNDAARAAVSLSGLLFADPDAP